MSNHCHSNIARVCGVVSEWVSGCVWVRVCVCVCEFRVCCAVVWNENWYKKSDDAHYHTQHCQRGHASVLVWWMSHWVSEWVNEWMSEWIKHRVEWTSSVDVSTASTALAVIQLCTEYVFIYILRERKKEREREREKERERERERERVCVCVRERKRECVSMCICVWVSEYVCENLFNLFLLPEFLTTHISYIINAMIIVV